MDCAVCAQSLSYVQLFATPRTKAHQDPLSMECSRQEYWSGLPFPPPGDLPDPGIEPASLASAGRFFTTELPGKPMDYPHETVYKLKALYNIFVILSTYPGISL